MFVKLCFRLVLLSFYANLLIESAPIIQGMSGEYSTSTSQEKLVQDAEKEDEDTIINNVQIVSFPSLPLSTTKDIEDLTITNPLDLGQSQTSISHLQETVNSQEIFQIPPKFEENIDDFHSDLLTSTVKSEYGNADSIKDSPSYVATTVIPLKSQHYIYSSMISNSEDDYPNANQMSLNPESKPNSKQTDSFVTTQQSGPVHSFMNGYYSDFEYQENDNVNEPDLEGSMNDDENYEFLQNYEDEDALPSALKNLPHDIPPDRTIYEVLAENIVKDKQYDEFRIEELIHELMDHYDTRNGLGEVYAGETEYDEIKARSESPDNTDNIPMLERIVEASSTASSD